MATARKKRPLKSAKYRDIGFSRCSLLNRCRHLAAFKDGQLDGILSIGDLVKAIISGQEFKIHFLQDYLYGRQMEKATQSGVR